MDEADLFWLVAKVLRCEGGIVRGSHYKTSILRFGRLNMNSDDPMPIYEASQPISGSFFAAWPDKWECTYLGYVAGCH